MFTSDDHHQMFPYAPRPLPTVDRHDRWKPTVELAPNCPRCDSSNTKFCYYNNYSLTQPRYFCKGCRRYWTKGGSLRNVPVGGGCRKNRRSKSVRQSRDTVEASHPSDSIRPDLALDGMAGSSSALTGSGSEGSSMDSSAAASDGSTIDLAKLYSKFLNQRPPPDSAALVVPELIDIDPFELMTTWNSNHQQLAEPTQGLSDPVSLDELDFSTDQISYGSLGFSLDEGVGDVFMSNFPIAPEVQGFHPIPNNSVVQQQQDLLIGDWSSFVHSNFEHF